MKTNNVMGVIFANVHDDLVSGLTAVRSMASIPFGGRYRLVDFPLSNLVNAGISKVGIIPKYNYHSLMDHLGAGKPWDLDRKSGGLYILPPYLTSDVNLHSGHIDSLDGIKNYLSHAKEKYIILCDADVVGNIDLKKMLNSHFENKADITIAYKNGELPKSHRDIMTFETEENGRITDIKVPEEPGSICDFSLDVVIMERLLLMQLVAQAKEKNLKHLWQDVILPGVNDYKIYGYNVPECAWVIDSPESYAKANFALLDPEIRANVFDKERPIYTKIRDDVPTKYGLDSEVKNSLIADGCVIKGKVKNCVLFRGVKVGENTVLENCIVMQDTEIGNNVRMKNVIADKNVVVGENQELCGASTHYMYIRKSSTV